MRPAIEGRQVSLADVGAEVLYVPEHAGGDLSHADVELATIESYTHSHVYVLFASSLTKHPVEPERLRWSGRLFANAIPAHFIDSIELWVREAVWPGDFLGELLKGCATGAWLRADDEARTHLGAIIGYLAMWVPVGCQGTPHAVSTWTGLPGWQARRSW